MSQPVPSPSAGTSQDERFPQALDPATAPLDDRDDAALTAAARRFAEKLAFWTGEGKFDGSVDWADFFPDLSADGLAAAEISAATNPQLALFLAFLKLHRHARNDFNGITSRHLDFHFRQVLRLAPEPAKADLAHLILSLKKSTRETRVPEGTLFATSVGLRYHSTSEIFVHATTLRHLRLIHRAADGVLGYAPIANSGDGLGSDLPEDDPSWHPFGAGRSLPAATTGFALSSPALLLGEGTRTITLSMELGFAGTPPATTELSVFFANHAVIELSGEKAWLRAGAPTVTVTVTGGNSRKIAIACELVGNAPAVVAFDPTVLEGAFDTVAPVMKLTVAGDAAPAVRSALAAATVTGISIKVDVEGMKNVIVENDHGRLDPSKPFHPFGPQPKAGSSFYIGAEEALSKKLEAAVLGIEWAGVPTNLATHYAAYKNGNQAIVPSNSYFTARFQILRDGRFENLSTENERLFHATDATNQMEIDSSDATLALTKISFASFATRFSRPVTTATFKLPFSNVAVSKPVATLAPVKALRFRDHLVLPAAIRRGRLSAATRDGFLRLILNQGFLQEKFADLYADAVSHNVADPAHKVPVPNRPYLPEIAAFTLGYLAATDTVNPNARNQTDFDGREIRFYHLHPFGQREEHAFIKRSVGAEDETVTLFPAFPDEGGLLLGLDGLEPRQDVSILFQVRDGSANPDATRRRIRWSVLASNHWKPFADEAVLADTTGGLLVSGTVRLALPAETTDHNTLLEPGMVWLRATVDERADAVCRLLDVRPNAVPVELVDPAAASHLTTALPPGSIQSAVTPVRGVREVAQPFASFGGAAAETDPAFHNRVAERRRHRGRAVTAWDYERLVLQQFPTIHRAKCLPHTRRDFSRAPGEVTLVVLPDLRGSAMAGSLTPKVDLATLTAIDEFLGSLNSPFVTAAAVNPAFERIELRFKVAFRKGLPFASYRAILAAEIDRKLAPWASAPGDGPGFGGVLYRSALVAFVDGLDYVDYVTDFELFHHPLGAPQPTSVQTAVPSQTGSILTSSGSHRIDPAS